MDIKPSDITLWLTTVGGVDRKVRRAIEEDQLRPANVKRKSLSTTGSRFPTPLTLN